MKRSPDERHTQRHGNLNDVFRRSQMPISIRRVNVWNSANYNFFIDTRKEIE